MVQIQGKQDFFEVSVRVGTRAEKKSQLDEVGAQAKASTFPRFGGIVVHPTCAHTRT